MKKRADVGRGPEPGRLSVPGAPLIQEPLAKWRVAAVAVAEHPRVAGELRQFLPEVV